MLLRIMTISILCVTAIGCEYRTKLYNSEDMAPEKVSWLYSRSPWAENGNVSSKVVTVDGNNISNFYGSEVLELLPGKHHLLLKWFDFNKKSENAVSGLSVAGGSQPLPGTLIFVDASYYESMPYSVRIVTKPGYSYTIDSFRAVQENSGARKAPDQLCILEFEHSAPGTKLSPNKSNVMTPPPSAIPVACGVLSTEK